MSDGVAYFVSGNHTFSANLAISCHGIHLLMKQIYFNITIYNWQQYVYRIERMVNCKSNFQSREPRPEFSFAVTSRIKFANLSSTFHNQIVPPIEVIVMKRKQLHDNTHLTLDERKVIQTGIENNSSKASIARTIGKDATTVAKEIRKHRAFRPAIHLITQSYVPE